MTSATLSPLLTAAPLLGALPAEATVLHLGPGGLAGLERYPATAARVVLVEADPARALALGPRLAHLTGAQVLARALTAGGAAGSGGEAELRRYSFPEFDGLAAPRAVRRIYPGLRERDRIPVPTLGLAELRDRLGPPPEEPGQDVLVIEAAGQVRPLLEALDAAGALARFGRLFARIGTEPLFEGEGRLDTLSAWLAERGWRVEVRGAEVDPDYPLLVAEAGPGGEARAPGGPARRDEVAWLSAERDELTGMVAELDRQTAELVQRLSEAEAERDRARAEAAGFEVGAAEAETLRAETAELRSLLAQREEALASAESRLGEAEETIAELRAELAEITPSEELKDQLVAAQERAAELSQTMLADQRMALRLQSTQQADLKALQDRYATLLEEKETRDRLLVQVTRRLGDAADFLKALPEPSEGEAEQDPAPAVEKD